MFKLTMTTKSRELIMRISDLIENDAEYDAVHMLKLEG